MKNVVWLDDNCKIMQNVISQVIRKLWSKNIRSDIFILDEKIKMININNFIFNSIIKLYNIKINFLATFVLWSGSLFV